jgi:hypothetical protein
MYSTEYRLGLRKLIPAGIGVSVGVVGSGDGVGGIGVSEVLSAAVGRSFVGMAVAGAVVGADPHATKREARNM